MKYKLLLSILVLLVAFPVPGLTENKDKKSYSPYVGVSYPENVYWGDTHLHTGLSLDAGAFGARLSPEDAYRLQAAGRLFPQLQK